MRSGDLGLIALIDGAPVGAGWLRYFAASDPGYGFVGERTPEMSGCGVGAPSILSMANS